MKTSTEHLPPCCREELRVLRSLTVRHIPDCCLIILGGNHAGQDYVSWSESVVRGRHTLYRHDYEIAVFVEGTETKKASRTLRRRIAGTYDGLFRFRRHTTPRLIVESVGTLTEQSKRGHLFYNGLVRNGILLYDNGGHVPCDCAAARSAPSAGGSRRPGFEKYFPDAVNRCTASRPGVTRRKLPAKRRRLHEACDKFYRTVWTVHTNHSPGTLPLDELGGLVKRYSREFAEIFPCHDDFEAESYELLCRAPKETRRGVFRYTRERLGYMLRGTEALRVLTQRICAERIGFYTELAEAAERKKGLSRETIFAGR